MDPYATLTSFDLLVLLILLGSAIVGMFRGFSTEVLTLASWAGAIFVTLFLVAPVSEMVFEIIRIDMAADLIASIIVFMISLALFKIAAARIGDGIKSSAIGALDRSLGTLFGLIRGLLIVFAGFLMLSYIIPETKQPTWIVNAKLGPMVTFGADLLTEVVPDLIQKGQDNDDIREIIKDMENSVPNTPDFDSLKEMQKRSKQMEDIINALEKPKPET